MSKMSDNSVNKILVGVLVFLCVAIVGLGVGIGVVMINDKSFGKSDLLKDGETYSMVASDLYYEVVEQFENDPDFTVQNGIDEFNEHIRLFNNDEFTIVAVVWCGEFMSEYGDGPLAALNYMEENTSGIDVKDLDKDSLIGFYSAAESFAEESGNTEKQSEYKQLLNDLGFANGRKEAAE